MREPSVRLHVQCQGSILCRVAVFSDDFTELNELWLSALIAVVNLQMFYETCLGGTIWNRLEWAGMGQNGA